MIKARSGDIIILGFSDENMERLKEGQPIKFDMTQLGIKDVTMYIFNGKDEKTMTEMFKDLITDRTKYFDYPKNPKEDN